MGGIAGIVGPGHLAASRRETAELLRQLRHRGPDGEGILEREGGAASGAVVMGQRRLGAIDPGEAGTLPMTSADGRRHVVLDGVITNRLEVRSALTTLGHRFRTTSDAELLVEGWAEWGLGTLQRLQGSFAFALLDDNRRVLVLARDQFGIRPLYYALSRGRLAFASEIAPLLGLAGVGRGVAPGPLADFLTRGVNDHPGRTMFADVHELPGAHAMEVELDATAVGRPACYWRPPDSLVHDLPLDEAAARFRELLEESVRLNLAGGDPAGVLLSGGKDSSAVLMLARRVLGAGARLHTFSYRGEDGAVDEAQWIEAARSAAGATGHELRLRSEEWSRDLRALVASQGEPFGSPVIYAQRRLFELAAATGVRVLLDGQGSDEYLAGYDRFRSGRLASLLYQGRFPEFVGTARAYGGPAGRWRSPVAGALALRWPALRKLRGLKASAPDALVDRRWLAQRGASASPRWSPRGREVLREMLAASLTTSSTSWLMRFADRNAMAFSIENRPPFLNTRLVEFALGLPEAHFISDDGTGKKVLREATRGLVPEVILARRDKVGFDVPVEAWLPRGPGMVGLLEESLAIPAVGRGRAVRLLEAVRRGEPLPRARAFEAWRLVTLAAWAREFAVAFD